MVARRSPQPLKPAKVSAATARPRAPAAKEVKLGKTLEFMRLLWALDHSLQSASKQMHANLGVTGLQRLSVRIVGRFPGISAGELAEVLHVHPSTLTGVLDKLVRREVLTRTPDPEDGRRALLTLTSRGRQIDELRVGTVEASVKKVLGDLSPEQLTTAKKVLNKLVQALQAPAPKRR